MLPFTHCRSIRLCLLGWLFLVAILLGGTSCERSSDRYAHFEVVEEGWDQGEELFFTIPKLPKDTKYNVSLALRIDRSIHYKELPIGIVIESPSRGITTQVVKVGTTPSDREMGGYNYLEINYPLPQATFQENGIYSYSICHLSTDSIVKGVIEVGLIIEPL